MQEFIQVTGMVIKAVPVFETDKRIVILTKERGAVTVFARGAKKPNNRFLATTDVFCYGTFKLVEGKSAYTLTDAHIENYFQDIRNDFEGAMYGMYFADVADYYCRENNDEKEMLKLLYASLLALLKDSISNDLVKCIYEMKALTINGEFPGVIEGHALEDTTKYTIEFVRNTPVEKLYSFTVSEKVLGELIRECEYYRKKYIGHSFKSLSILESCKL